LTIRPAKASDKGDHHNYQGNIDKKSKSKHLTNFRADKVFFSCSLF
jgi:hypothetical protein